MITEHVRTYLILISLSLYSCSKFLQTTIEQESTTSIYSDDNLIKEKDSLELWCGDKSILLEEYSEVSFQQDGPEILECIINRANQGEAEYYNQLKLFFRDVSPMFIRRERYHFLRNKKFRGRDLFFVLFDRAKNFDCMLSPDGYDQGNYSTLFEHFYAEMIESVDGKTYDSYMAEVIPNGFDALMFNDPLAQEQLSLMISIEKDRCDTIVSRIKYQHLKKAIVKDLISYKGLGVD